MIETLKIRAIQRRYREMKPVLNERSRRRFAAVEALALGHGGVTVVSEITGLARRTIYRGIKDLKNRDGTEPGRVRKKGGGRKAKSVQDPRLISDIKGIVEAATRGDPMSPLLWTSRSVRNVTRELLKGGHRVCATVVGQLLRGMGYSLQANAKTREGKDHKDRDAQFRYINAEAKKFLKANNPVISVDTKKKEIVGNFKNVGSELRPQGNPEKVNVHDFPDPKKGRAVPYGIYDIHTNTGWVSVGTSCDTGTFAVNAIRSWWKNMGRKRYPNPKGLLINADAGGSNGHRTRLWKVELQKLTDELRIPITVCHFPPGTSKWNKIEHRLFSFITINWRGKPLRSYRTIVQLIAATTTEAGLTVKAMLDENTYQKGIKVSKKEFDALNISRHTFHGDWNYTIRPRQKRKKTK